MSSTIRRHRFVTHRATSVLGIRRSTSHSSHIALLAGRLPLEVVDYSIRAAMPGGAMTPQLSPAGSTKPSGNRNLTPGSGEQHVSGARVGATLGLESGQKKSFDGEVSPGARLSQLCTSTQAAMPETPLSGRPSRDGLGGLSEECKECKRLH